MPAGRFVSCQSLWRSEQLLPVETGTFTVETVHLLLFAAVAWFLKKTTTPFKLTKWKLLPSAALWPRALHVFIFSFMWGGAPFSVYNLHHQQSWLACGQVLTFPPAVSLLKSNWNRLQRRLCFSDVRSEQSEPPLTTTQTGSFVWNSRLMFDTDGEFLFVA